MSAEPEFQMIYLLPLSRMLNPTAAEFQPSGSFQPQPGKSNPQSNVNSTPQQKPKAKKQSVDNGKNVGTERRHSKPSQNKPEAKRQGSAPDAAYGRKGSSSKQSETKARVDGGKSRTNTNRTTTNGKNKTIDPRISLVAASVKTKSTSKVQNMEPTSCITIMEAIEPVNLVTGEGPALSIANGCELYVQWVCLSESRYHLPRYYHLIAIIIIRLDAVYSNMKRLHSLELIKVGCAFLH
jgi:hypothetical protein